MIAHTQIWLIGRGLEANARCVVQNLNVHAEFSAVLPKSLENPFRVVTVGKLWCEALFQSFAFQGFCATDDDRVK